jgi:hypothetical protein
VATVLPTTRTGCSCICRTCRAGSANSNSRTAGASSRVGTTQRLHVNEILDTVDTTAAVVCLLVGNLDVVAVALIIADDDDVVAVALHTLLTIVVICLHTLSLEFGAAFSVRCRSLLEVRLPSHRIRVQRGEVFSSLRCRICSRYASLRTGSAFNVARCFLLLCRAFSMYASLRTGSAFNLARRSLSRLRLLHLVRPLRPSQTLFLVDNSQQFVVFLLSTKTSASKQRTEA